MRVSHLSHKEKSLKMLTRRCAAVHALITVRLRHCFSTAGVMLGAALSAEAQVPPPLPDSSGWGVHVLSVARDPRGAIWVGTYGHGIYRLAVGATVWEQIRHDTTGSSISWDFVQALAFGARGQIWYGTIGNGWGMSTYGGTTWKNWTYNQLGPEWQYVTPSGIVVRETRR